MDPEPAPPAPQPTAGCRSWSIYGRSEITDLYEILNRIGSGAYADVYRARRRSDNLTVGVGELKQWMMQVLRGADDCRRSLVVHRDLKPSNLLVSEASVLKLADFGQIDWIEDIRQFFSQYLESGVEAKPSKTSSRNGG